MARKKKKRTKTLDRLLSLSDERKNEIGILIEQMMKNELSYICYSYVQKYKSAVRDTFGWDEDDLKQYIREVLWKGIATYDPDHEKGSKLKTFLSTILYYQMGNLSKRCQNKKNSMSKLYCADTLFDVDETIDSTTGEDWLNYRQNFKILIGNLSKVESKILVLHLVEGCSIEVMQKKLNIDRPTVVGSILSIKKKMKKHLGDEHE